MKDLIKWIGIFMTAVMLFVIIAPVAIWYNIIMSIFEYRKHSFYKYWINLLYAMSIAIDNMGNVIIADFMNRAAIIKKGDHLFGNPSQTVSYVLAKNLDNLTRFGKGIVWILEKVHPGHMKYVLTE